MDSAGSLHLHEGAPVVLADRALPLRLYVERPVVDHYGLDPVITAARAWTVAGSSVTVSVHEAGRHITGEPRRDGSSRVFADPDCDRGTLAYTAPHTDRLVIRDRPVATATEVDIGVCDAAPDGVDAATAMFVHELGHALGMAHQCPYPTDCWQPGMPTTAEHDGCRTMTADITCVRPTEIGVLDAQAVIRAYPLLRRLGGADPADTAAWVAWHLYPRPVDGIVVVASDASPTQQLQATVRAATRGWPLLIGAGDDTTCHRAFTTEVRRLTQAHTTRHTYGQPPPACRTHLRPLREARAPRATTSRVVLLPADAAMQDGWLAAYAAARLHARLVIADSDTVHAEVDDATTIALVGAGSTQLDPVGDHRPAPARELLRIARPQDVDRLTGTPASAGIVAARMATDGPAAVALAAAAGLEPVPLDRGLTWRLRPDVTGRSGYVVGGPNDLPDAAQSWLSQLAAGVDDPVLPDGW